MYRIGIIVTWFGKLPDYFAAWQKSAESNQTIDFIIISDQKINSDSSNIRYIKSTLSNEVGAYEKKLKRKVCINNAYKFCDCRLFFGLLYEDVLKQYDFWGYCDIDLVFGDIRKFISDEILTNYDRIYTYGHLCLYRNNDMMKHIYDLEGGIYSLDEIFVGKAKTTPEEHFGVNKICLKNGIRVYHEIDFADINVMYENRMDMLPMNRNSKHQVFLWQEGHAYRLYYDEDILKNEELVYIHWQKKNPGIKSGVGDFKFSKKFIITPESIITEYEDELTLKTMDFYNPVLNDDAKKKARKKYYIGQLKKFLLSSVAVKKIWMRQMGYRTFYKIKKIKDYE